MPFPTPEDLDVLTSEEQNALNERRKLRWKKDVSNSRLSLPFLLRLPIATTFSFVGGMILGISHGSKKANLLFRAENAHRLPNTPTNWYLYHKTKNYKVSWAGIKEGVKMGTRMSLWVAGYFGLENALDLSWGRTDFLSSVVSSMVVAGGFSIRSEFVRLLFILSPITGCFVVVGNY